MRCEKDDLGTIKKHVHKRPYLDYCDIMYYIPSPTNGSLNSVMAKLEKIQYYAGLAITGACSNRNKLDEHLCWERLTVVLLGESSNFSKLGST